MVPQLLLTMLTFTPGNFPPVTIFNNSIFLTFHFCALRLLILLYLLPRYVRFCDPLNMLLIWILDFRLHIYDTTAPPAPHSRHSYRGLPSDSGLKTNMKVMKTIQGHPGRWTITDANLSPDNQRLGFFLL